MNDAAKTAFVAWDKINIVGPFPSRLPDRNTRKVADYLHAQKPSIAYFTRIATTDHAHS